MAYTQNQIEKLKGASNASTVGQENYEYYEIKEFVMKAMTCSLLDEAQIGRLHSLVAKCDKLVQDYKIAHPVAPDQVEAMKQINTAL